VISFARTNRYLSALCLVSLAALGLPGPANAQVFVNPFIGYDFSGDSGCPQITGCEDKNLNWGVSLGAVGRIVGAEIEIAHTDGFFGETAETKTSVTTVMGHFLLAPGFGPIQPYGLAGARSHQKQGGSDRGGRGRRGAERLRL
jgi:hypothetical protein